MNILLAIDDSKFSNAATDAVIALAKTGDAEVKVLHVIEPVPLYLDGEAWGYGAKYVPISDEERNAAQELVARHTKRLRDAGINVSAVIKQGVPKVVILDMAKEWSPDLIVVGSHGRKGLDRFFLGSVSEAITRHAPCSVEVVRLQPS